MFLMHRVFTALLVGVLGYFTAFNTLAAVPSSYSLWAEFLGPEKLLPHVEKLAQHGVTLFPAIHEEDLDLEITYIFLKRCQSAGLKFRPWILLSAEKGYWINKWNVREAREVIDRFLQESRSRNIQIDWIIFDLEPHKTIFDRIHHLLSERSFKELLRYIKKQGNKISWKEAKASFSGLVAHLHAQGVKVHAVNMPFILEDFVAHSRRLQHNLGIPLEGIPYDEVSFMIYRPFFMKLAWLWNSDIVHSYALDAVKYFGDRAGIDVGPFGSVGINIPDTYFRKPKEVLSDFAASAAAGVRNHHLFSYDGVLEQQYDVDDFYVPQPKRPFPDLGVGLLRMTIRNLARWLPEPKN